MNKASDEVPDNVDYKAFGLDDDDDDVGGGNEDMKNEDDNPWNKEAANTATDGQVEETMADHLKALATMEKAKDDQGGHHIAYASSNLIYFWN